MVDEQPRIAEPVEYYDEYGEDEWDRLDRTPSGRLEFENTVTYLDEQLPEDGHILDAGGGAGRYTAWLVERGYDVTLLDASAEQLRVAGRKVDAADGDYRRIRGSVHALPFRAEQFDATLCLGGPLSHLTDEQWRRDAAAELNRVTATGGPLLASAMGRLHVLLKLLQTGRKLDVLPDLARTGTYDQELLARHDRSSSRLTSSGPTSYGRYSNRADSRSIESSGWRGSHPWQLKRVRLTTSKRKTSSAFGLSSRNCTRTPRSRICRRTC